MNRRRFLLNTASFGAMASTARLEHEPVRFTTRFAPKLGLFDHHAPDAADQVQFIADQGFRAVEDSRFLDRPPAEQDRFLRAVQRNGLQLGSFLSYLETEQPTFVESSAAFRSELRERMKRAVDAAARLGTRWTTIIPGAAQPRLSPEQQAQNAADNLRACVEVCAPAGVTILIEPLNRITVPGIFLSRTAQAVDICEAVHSPHVKILFDVFHQQMGEGNLTNTIRMAWPYIAYFQWADVPTRAEPGTGEINFVHLLRTLTSLRYGGLIGLDHTPLASSRAGERAVVAAYRELERAAATP